MKTPIPSLVHYTRHVRWTLLLIGAAALVSLGLVALQNLFPGGFFSPYVQGQLRSFGQLSLLHLLFLPGIPATFLLLRSPSTSPWMSLAGPIWGLGALLLAAAFLTGGVEAGWSYAIASPITRDLVSPLQLLGLLCASLATELLALQILVQSSSPFSGNFHEAAPAVASRILALAIPVQASQLLVALLERLSGMNLFSTTAFPLLPAYINAWAWTPLALGLLLLAASLSATLLAADTHLPCGPFPLALAGLSLFAPQLTLLPATLPSFVYLCILALHCLLAACIWALAFRILPTLFLHAPPITARSLPAIGSLLLSGFLLPIHLWANLLQSNGSLLSPGTFPAPSLLLLFAITALSGVAVLLPAWRRS